MAMNFNRLTRIRSAIAAFAGSRSGATAIEYGLVAALIGVAIISVISGVGTMLGSTFIKILLNLG